jgi:hypothetical protein
LVGTHPAAHKRWLKNGAQRASKVTRHLEDADAVRAEKIAKRFGVRLEVPASGERLRTRHTARRMRAHSMSNRHSGCGKSYLLSAAYSPVPGVR